MSDLLPLIATVLKDKVAIEAREEIDGLKRDIARSVEIVRAQREDENEDSEVVVYASGQFQDGKYGGNANLWQVDLKSAAGQASCRLVDLRECLLCVGGGFLLESLNDQQSNRAHYEGFLDRYDHDSDTSKTVSFCFCPNSTWLTIVVHGWPRESWQADVEEDTVYTITELVKIVGTKFPDATIEFLEVSFVSGNFHAALKRMLPPKRKTAVRAERDERGRQWSQLVGHVAVTMQQQGNRNDSALYEVMDMLTRSFGIEEVTPENEELIENIIGIYQRCGRDTGRAEAVIQRTLDQMDDPMSD